jgi:hypothetical protein
MEWIAHAQIDRPAALKGTSPPAPIYLSRRELSFLAPFSSTTPIWQTDFGELKPDGQAVLFWSEGSEPTVVPAGDGQNNLVTLVKDIVRIQALANLAAQRSAWLEYLRSAPSGEGGRVALRSLIRAGAEWKQMEAAVQALPPDANLRAFAFALVAFNLVAETWGTDSAQAVDFLCGTFLGERDVEQQLRALQSFKLLLRYTTEEPRRESRRPLRERVLNCLQTWASRGLSDKQLEQEYQQIRSQY